MSPVGFEPTISAGERPQTYALDRTATGTGFQTIMLCRNINRQSPGDTTPYHSGMETLICRFEGLKYVISSLKAPYTLSVRLSDFTV